jgi:carbonic anhydrase
MSAAAAGALLGAEWAVPAAQAEGGAPWSYADPGHWPRYAAACGGSRQSPIDLGAALPGDAAALVFAWSPFAADLAHDGHTLQVSPRSGAGAGGITLGDKIFDFRQFHFHHPSEHALGGNRWPLEMHLVHQQAGGTGGDASLAVIGILFRPGRENDALGKVLRAIPRPGQQRPLPDPVDLTGFLPANAATFFYQGSLTTPPCSETVNWIVFRDPIEAGIGQIESMKLAFPKNARPLQPVSGRPVGLDLF